MCVVARGSALLDSGAVRCVGAILHVALAAISVAAKSLRGERATAKLGTTMWSLGRSPSGMVDDQPPSLRRHVAVPEISSGYPAATFAEPKRSVCITETVLLASTR